jgi:hypothetical protein
VKIVDFKKEIKRIAKEFPDIYDWSIRTDSHDGEAVLMEGKTVRGIMSQRSGILVIVEYDGMEFEVFDYSYWPAEKCIHLEYEALIPLEAE